LAEHGLKRWLDRLLPPTGRSEKVLPPAILFVLLMVAFYAVNSTLWGPDWASLWRGLALGLLLGWVLAFFHQNGGRTAGIVLLAGILYLLVYPGGLGGGLSTLLGSLVPFGGKPSDPAVAQQALQGLAGIARDLFQRVQTWAGMLMTGETAFDPFMSALAWDALAWLVAAWAGWIIEARRNVLLAVLPAVAVSLWTLNYARRNSLVLYLCLGLSLLLLGIVQFHRARQTWDRDGVAYPAHKGAQMGGTALLASFLLVVLAAILSSFSFRQVRDWVSEQNQSGSQGGDLGGSLGIASAQTSTPDAFTALRNPILPRYHLIGSGPELSQRVVMQVKVANLTALSSDGPLPLYWRGSTYDEYTGHGWRTSNTTRMDYAADQPLQVDQIPHHVLVQLDVSPVENLGGTAYLAGEPVTLDRPSRADWRYPDDLFQVSVGSQSSYQAFTQLPSVDEQILRLAGTDYPDWVRQRYLSLPEEVPERVRALAASLTDSQPTPYDKAWAIETYLRQFPYTLDVSAPPPQRDLVDYFLFDLKKGYCDY
jgi:hypothetical protein